MISRKCLLNVWSGKVIGGVDGIAAEIHIIIITSDLKEIQLNKSATAAVASSPRALTHSRGFLRLLAV